MTSRDFCYWLQGYFELTKERSATGIEMNKEQVRQIQNHLTLVFVHEIDPANVSLGVDAETAQAIHDQHKPQIGGTDGNGNVYRC